MARIVAVVLMLPFGEDLTLENDQPAVVRLLEETLAEWPDRTGRRCCWRAFDEKLVSERWHLWIETIC
jgi:hypothetical protein